MKLSPSRRSHFCRAAVERRFNMIQSQLKSIVADAEIHHVGSTAIPGLLTKGDLDVQIRVSAEQFEYAKAELARLYPVNEGGFRGSEAISFEDYTAQPSVGIHLTVTGSPSDVQVRFRDLLLSSSTLRREYDELKRLHEGCPMEEYRMAKAEFVGRVLSGNFSED